MADAKISQLPVATSSAGTDVLPIVQSNTTKQLAIQDLVPQNLKSNATTGVLQVTGPAAGATRVMTTPNANFTAARTDAAQTFTGNQTVSAGNYVLGTASKGVDFSINTHFAGSISAVLADYDTGTWVPADYSGAGLTITVDHAYYTKIGNRVFASAYIIYPVTADTSLSRISLPYAATYYDIGTASSSNGAVYSVLTIAGVGLCNFRNVFTGTLTNAALSGASILLNISYS